MRCYDPDQKNTRMSELMNLRSDSNVSRRGLSTDVGSGCTLYLVLR